MQRLYVSPDSVAADKVIIRGDLLRKIQTVLRMKIHDRLCVFDGSGSEYLCEIVSGSRAEIELAILQEEHPPTEPVQEIVLGQALPKADKMSLIIQKAVELGVTAVFPVITERAVPRYEERRLQARIPRWQRVALEAAQQSGRVSVPEVKPVVTFDRVVAAAPSNSLKIILHQRDSSMPLKALLQGSGKRKSIFALVGPEGGFAAEEIDLAARHGFLAASLGPRTLRTETVALAFLSMLQYAWYERG